MLAIFHTNIAQLTGLICFAIAAGAAGMAARGSVGNDARVWTAVCFIQCLLFLELFFEFRYRTTAYVATLLRANDLYARMHGQMQEVVIISIAIVASAFGLIFLVWRRVAGGAARIALAITLTLVVLFATETISLHALDAIFYRPVGPLAMIVWWWIILTAGVSLAAYRHTPHNSRGY